jgi:hypothetical protein
MKSKKQKIETDEDKIENEEKQRTKIVKEYMKQHILERLQPHDNIFPAIKPQEFHQDAWTFETERFHLDRPSNLPSRTRTIQTASRTTPPPKREVGSVCNEATWDALAELLKDGLLRKRIDRKENTLIGYTLATTPSNLARTMRQSGIPAAMSKHLTDRLISQGYVLGGGGKQSRRSRSRRRRSRSRRRRRSGSRERK